MSDTLDDLFFTIDGKECCDEEACLAILLSDGVLVAASVETKRVTQEKTCVALFVICIDLFAWARADGLDLTYDQIGPLTKMHLTDKEYGASRWACLQRNEKPQKPVEKRWREHGTWDDVMEALPPNKYDAFNVESGAS